MNIYKHFNGVKITFEGNDSFDFLQRLSSNDISLSNGNVIQSVFLDRRARVISPFYLIKDKYYNLIVSSEFKKDAISYIETMHFSEDLKCNIKDIVWTEERYTQDSTTDVKYKLPDWTLDKAFMGAFYEVIVGDNMQEEFERLSYKAISPEIDNVCFRSIMILDGPFDHFISRNKGCYPGQEVVEKIYSNRRPKEMFVCHIESQIDRNIKHQLFYDNKKQGDLLAPIPDENTGYSMALAFVRSNKCNVGDVLTTEDGLNVKLVGKTSVSFEQKK